MERGLKDKLLTKTFDLFMRSSTLFANLAANLVMNTEDWVYTAYNGKPKWLKKETIIIQIREGLWLATGVSTEEADTMVGSTAEELMHLVDEARAKAKEE